MSKLGQLIPPPTRTTWRVGAGYGISPNHVPSFSATYIKAYLLENGACVAKKKTKVAKKTCDPLYQQALLFDEGPQGKVLQVSVYRVDAQVQVKH